MKSWDCASQFLKKHYLIKKQHWKKRRKQRWRIGVVTATSKSFLSVDRDNLTMIPIIPIR